jgi:hypothetical protein
VATVLYAFSILTCQIRAAVVFPLAVAPGAVQDLGGVAFDGSNFLVAVESGATFGAQFVSSSGSLVGGLIVAGPSGGFPPSLAVAYGAGVYLEVWSDTAIKNGPDMFGQLISPKGTKVGAKFSLLPSAAGFGFQNIEAEASAGGNFLVVWEDKSTSYFYGQLVSLGGTLVGGPFLISNQSQNGNSAAASFDGAHYLVVWQSNNNDTGNDNKTYGEFISVTGVAQTPFQINQTDSRDQDPLAVVFDGTNYLVAWTKDTQVDVNSNALDWTPYGRLVSPNGTMPGNEVVLSGALGNQVFPNLAFDGQNFLVTWTAYTNVLTKGATKGQFFDASLDPVGTVFTAVPDHGANGALPTVAGLAFGGGRFLLGGATGTIQHNASGNITGFANLEAWGVIVPPTQTPVAITSPPANETVLVGETAVFSVSATGSALNYQWLKNRAKLAPGPRFSGINSSTLTISNATLTDAGSYSVVTSNLFGTATSANATLTVDVPAVITGAANPRVGGTASGGGSFMPGDKVIVTATVTNDCYFFTNWTANGKVASTSASYIFTASKSETLTANFSPYVYMIQTASLPAKGGTTTGGGAKACGSSVEISARPTAGFRFTNWTVNGDFVSTNAAYHFTASSDVLLTANFINITPPTVTVTSPASETTTNNTVTLAGKANDNLAVMGVYFYVEGSASGVSPANSATHWTNWTATVPLALGTNIIKIYATDSSGLTSAAKTVVVVRKFAAVTRVFPLLSNEYLKNLQEHIAFDGTNYLVVFQLDVPNNGNNNGYNSDDVAQFVSSTGEPSGDILALNPSGAGDPPTVAFDGTNYLTGWADYSHEQNGVPLMGNFVGASGAIGSPFQLTESETADSFGTMVFGAGVYFLAWGDSRGSSTNGGNDDLFGAMVTPDGSLVVPDFEIAPQVQVSEEQTAGGFDGTNFLVVWSSVVGKTSLNGQIISPSGALVTAPFEIYSNTMEKSSGLNSVVFDGTKYLVLSTLEVGSGALMQLRMLGRFVAPNGTVLTNQFVVSTDTGPQLGPCAAFDGVDYLVTWDRGFNPFIAGSDSGNVLARFFDAEGTALGSEFTLFAQQGTRVPFVAPVLYDGTRFFSVTGLGKLISTPPNIGFTNSIIDGAFVYPPAP